MIPTPEERARAWHDAVSAQTPDREVKRHVLAALALQLLSPELVMRPGALAAAVKDSFELLELSGLIAREELREAFAAIDESAGTASAFAGALGRGLREAAMTARLSATDRDRAGELAEQWRIAAAEIVTNAVEDDRDAYVTIAEVAALCNVTPQAVHTWIRNGVIEAHPRSGGPGRVPVWALASDTQFDVGRARRLQLMLARRHERQGEVPAKKMLEQIRSRKPPSA